VLVLRAGLGQSKRTSRARIATTLDLTASQVARVERSGVRRLRTRARSGVCDKDAGTAGRVVRDAVATLRAGGAPADGDRAAVLSDPAASRTTEAAGGDKTTARLVAVLAVLVGFVLIARGLLKAQD
jgi:hypothetical protein